MRIIIEWPKRILHLEAEYTYADCPFANFKPLAIRRRTTLLPIERSNYLGAATRIGCSLRYWHFC